MRATEVYILFMGRLAREVASAKEIYSSKNLKKRKRTRNKIRVRLIKEK